LNKRLQVTRLYSANGSATYIYDQENRISSTAGMTYAYDANGNRVEKSRGSTGALYWYGAPGTARPAFLPNLISPAR